MFFPHFATPGAGALKSGLSHGMMRRDRENEAAPFRVCGYRGRLEIQGDGHMLDDLIELALELIFEGAMESAHARRKPLYARLALAGILLVLFAGVTGLLVWAGITSQSWLLIALGAALLALGAGLIVWLVRKRRERRDRS